MGGGEGVERAGFLSDIFFYRPAARGGGLATAPEIGGFSLASPCPLVGCFRAPRPPCLGFDKVAPTRGGEGVCL